MQVRIKKCYADCISISNEKGTEIRPLDISGLFWDIMVRSFTSTSVLRSKLLIVQTDLREI